MSGKCKERADVGYAWVIVAAAFVMQGCAVGVFSGFGVFLEYYTNDVFPNEEKSKVAMIGNLTPFVLGMGSILTGRICQRFGVQVCIFLGAIFMMLGLVLASFGSQVWHFVLTQGILVGFGGALIFVPANVAITEWFETKRGLAAGIGASGGGIGGAVFGQLNTLLLKHVGLEWALRVNGCVVFVVLLLSAAMVRRRETQSADGKADSFDMSLVLNGRFIWFVISAFFGGCAYLIPLYFINNYAISIGMTRAQAGYAGAAINLGSAIGRVSIGFLSDHTGHLRCCILAVGLTTLASCIWCFSSSFAMLVVFGIAYGIPSGGYAGGFGPVCAIVFGKRQLATMMGLSYSFVGVGELLGPIMCGHLIDTFHNYQFIIYYTISGYALAFLAVCLAYYFTIVSPPPQAPL
ncbi:hypothetical protein DSO57_1021398 [Entomophthora muscae]|uniref:Uncharacterized protein n=1 Tax=Entomophthora muscae TaxID=34485 RepID=A0ACC2RUF6_9FUNG|nr:hypothetical protein DSO57_1021398 [Entomophthora muscae]